VRHHPSKSSVVQKSQSQQKRSSWACTGLQTLGHDRLAVFCLGDSSRQKTSPDSNSERPIAEDGGIEGDKDAGQDINETNRTDQDSDSASLCQKNGGTNEPDSSNNDRSQHQSNTSSDGTDNVNAQGDHNAIRKGDGRYNSQEEIPIGTKQAKINRLLEKIEKSIKTRTDNHDEYTRLLNRSLWKGIDFVTSAQWHFDSLVDSAENDPVRVVLHKLSLHQNLKERIEQGALHGHIHPQYKRRYKDDMMQESPSFRALDRKHQESKRHLFDLYLRQGAVFDTLFILCPGLVGLVAPLLTTSEYGLLLIDVSVLIFSIGYRP